MVLDLEQVNFIDSSGLGAVVAAMKRWRRAGGWNWPALTPAVDKVFRLTRMDSVFHIHPDADTARAPVRQAS